MIWLKIKKKSPVDRQATTTKKWQSCHVDRLSNNGKEASGEDLHCFIDRIGGGRLGWGWSLPEDETERRLGTKKIPEGFVEDRAGFPFI